ncbi:HAMP domain-containing sensor histidine kinase [Mediterraneibacter massiliensis]|uniref:sensor histidine kinase n=1 Tax=Mediterraneibacter massiliensis TaxID=1720300 RepID=UPI002F3E8544
MAAAVKLWKGPSTYMTFYLTCILFILSILLLWLSIKIWLLKKSAREIETQFTARLQEDTNILISISGRDPSMQKLAAQINVQLKELRVQRHRFLQGDLELKEAVTNISHDLRTPLTAIFGYLDLLEKEETTETAERYLHIVRERAVVLRQLTEELFRYSVFSSLSKEVNYTPVILNKALEYSISAYYAALKQKKICPVISLSGEKIQRTLDFDMLLRIFANILSNVLKYSDGDLHITLENTGEIIFSNHAANMDEIQAKRLFDRFYTVETASKSTGLGLSIAKALTEQMHGTIDAVYHDGVLSIHLFFPA